VWFFNVCICEFCNIIVRLCGVFNVCLCVFVGFVMCGFCILCVILQLYVILLICVTLLIVFFMYIICYLSFHNKDSCHKVETQVP
jgi:Flp pilus assembly protein TadB